MSKGLLTLKVEKTQSSHSDQTDVDESIKLITKAFKKRAEEKC
jgi:hypothetical protein